MAYGEAVCHHIWVGKRLEMDDETAAFGAVSARYADVWVFALFEPQAHPAGDILDPSLSRFYVVTNAALEARVAEQKTAVLATIEQLARPVHYDSLRPAIDQALMI